MERFDAIVIPGGGMHPGGQLPPWVLNRLDRAADLAPQARFLIALSAATVYKPAEVDGQGRVMFESVVAARELMRRGVAREKLLVETASYDTVGNAYFCRMIHCDPRELRRVHVVTSEFHLARTQAAFRWIFGAAPNPGYELSFEAMPDVGLSPTALAARREKERQGAEQALENAGKYRTLAEVHRFLFAEHDVYAAARWEGAQHTITPEVLESY